MARSLSLVTLLVVAIAASIIPLSAQAQTINIPDFSSTSSGNPTNTAAVTVTAGPTYMG